MSKNHHINRKSGRGSQPGIKGHCGISKRNYPHLRVKVIDYMELTHPRLHVAGQFFFVQWMKHFPSVYGYLFQKRARKTRSSIC